MDMDKFSVYDDIRAKLLAGGIPAELILDVCHGCFVYGAGDCFSTSWVTGSADLFCAVLAERAWYADCGMAGQPMGDSAGGSVGAGWTGKTGGLGGSKGVSLTDLKWAVCIEAGCPFFCGRKNERQRHASLRCTGTKGVPQNRR